MCSTQSRQRKKQTTAHRWLLKQTTCLLDKKKKNLPGCRYNWQERKRFLWSQDFWNLCCFLCISFRFYRYQYNFPDSLPFLFSLYVWYFLIFEWKPTMKICDDASNMKIVFFEKAWADTIVWLWNRKKPCYLWDNNSCNTKSVLLHQTAHRFGLQSKSFLWIIKCSLLEAQQSARSSLSWPLSLHVKKGTSSFAAQFCAFVSSHFPFM